MKTTQNRRSILLNTAKGTLGLIAAITVGPLFFSACKKKDADQSADQNRNENALCPDQDGLTDQDKGIRNSLKYVDTTPIQARTCDNCKLYTNPIPGAFRGGCKVVPGPIHPKGYCTAWLHRM